MDHLDAPLYIQTAERIFGRYLAPNELDAILMWVDEYGFAPELVEAVLKAGQRQGVMTVPYLAAIARRWYDDGIRTLADLSKRPSGRAVAGSPKRKPAPPLPADPSRVSYEAEFASLHTRCQELERRVAILERMFYLQLETPRKPSPAEARKTPLPPLYNQFSTERDESGDANGGEE